MWATRKEWAMRWKKTACRHLVLLLILCAWAGVAGRAGTVFALSLDEESELGRKFLVDVRKHYRFVEDEFAVDYLNRLGRHLEDSLDRQPFPLRYYIIQENDLNAFAGPGGHIFFFTGLIDAMDRADELASVMTHEMGHISARHLSHRIEQNKKINVATLAGVLAGILIGGKAAQAIIVGSTAAAVQTQLAFSRADERQADQLGFAFMRTSGFDPAAMITVLKKMQSGQVYGTDQVPVYLRTHPTGPQRMADMDSLLAAGDPASRVAEAEALRDDFQIFRTLLMAMHGDPNTVLRRLRSDLENDPDSWLAHFGLGVRLKEDAAYDRAVEHLKTALKHRPDLLPALTQLGETYQLTGRYTEAIPVLEKALSRDAGNRTALFLLATSYQNLESYDRAIRLYERLLSMEPVKDEVFYNLGLCYGRMDRLVMAHYHFGLFFTRSNEPGKARFHFQKAEELGRHDMDMLQKIRKAAEDLPR